MKIRGCLGMWKWTSSGQNWQSDSHTICSVDCNRNHTDLYGKNKNCRIAFFSPDWERDLLKDCQELNLSRKSSEFIMAFKHTMRLKCTWRSLFLPEYGPQWAPFELTLKMYFTCLSDNKSSGQRFTQKKICLGNIRYFFTASKPNLAD